MTSNPKIAVKTLSRVCRDCKKKVGPGERYWDTTHYGRACFIQCDNCHNTYGGTIPTGARHNYKPEV